jgi:hypothetical protein
VNWLASSGVVGSWFFNCVINIVRKLEKLLDRLPSALVPTCEAVAALEAVAGLELLLVDDEALTLVVMGISNIRL